MSAGDNATLVTSSRHDGAYELSGGYEYGVGDLVASSYKKS